ncbi:hypothetical protein HDU93_006480, partial [Gonapodya sp. JEL0774]
MSFGAIPGCPGRTVTINCDIIVGNADPRPLEPHDFKRFVHGFAQVDQKGRNYWTAITTSIQLTTDIVADTVLERLEALILDL